jgi:hypothetical protein
MSKDTGYIVKSNPKAGALPDTQTDLDNAVSYRQRLNEKAVEGKINLKHADPLVLGGDTIVVRGVGPLYDGLFTVTKHTLTLSKSGGLKSVLDVSRNAVGDSGTEPALSGADSGTEPAPSGATGAEGSETSDEQLVPPPVIGGGVSFDDFQADERAQWGIDQNFEIPGGVD